MTEKTFDLQTADGFRRSERFKASLEKKGYRVVVQPVGLNRVRITGFLRRNPPRVRGRKVKGGGRSISLRNFTGTVVRKSDGSVHILGKGRRR